MEALAPLFNSCVPLRLRRTLARDPVLIKCNESSSYEDAESSLQSFATSVGIQFCSVDSRLVQRYPTKKSYQNMHSTIAHAQGSIFRLTNLDIDTILLHTPCILYIENFDMIFNDPAQQHNTSPEDSLDELFYTAFVAFLKDLYEAWDAKCEREADPAGVGEVGTIVVAVCSKYANKLKPSMRSLFGSEIQLTTMASKRTDTLNTVRSALGVSGVQHNNSNVSIDISADGERALLDHIETHCMSVQIIKKLVNEVKLTALARYQFSVWMDTISPACSAVLAGGNPSTVCHHPQGTMTITAGDMQRTLRDVPYLSGFDTVNGCKDGNGKAQHKQAKIAAVHWADIGGLDRVRKEILDVLELPFQYPELFPPGCPRRQGVLLYGPPGTGKTLVARAVATECGMSFISVKGPELLDMYVGESEKNVREIFQRARDAAPCVLFFDEIDSLAPARARGNASGGGIMDRMVSQLLTEMDMVGEGNAQACAESHALSVRCAGSNNTAMVEDQHNNQSQNGELMALSSPSAVEENKHQGGDAVPVSGATGTAKANGKFVFIIGATNRPDLLDPALLRPGRFDRKIYLGVCKDIPSRLQILHAQTRKFTLSPNTDLTLVAGALPENITGADIGAVTSSAYSHALQRKLQTLREQALAHIQKQAIVVDTDAKDPDDWAVQAYINRLPEQDLKIIVEQDDLLQAARSIQPSVVDLAYYEGLGAIYDDSCAVI